jgi:hypothetical protein
MHDLQRSPKTALQRAEQRLRRLAWNTRMLPRRLLERHVRAHRVANRIRHVHGPAAVQYADDEVLVICVVRNGAVHVRDFVEHHLRLGVRHLVLLDNGSTDDTVALAAEYDPVTVLQTDLPYRHYENVLKRYLAQRFSSRRWNLCVDIDERFDYPFSGRIALRDFIAYLNARSSTVVLAQLLDLFAADIVDDRAGAPPRPLREAHPWYDLSGIEKEDYAWGAVPDPAIRMHWGGIRRTLFGTRNGLTKAALVRVQPEVELFHDWHHVRNGRIADVTCVLLHYPFAGSFTAKVADAVTTGRYGPRTTVEYRAYHEGLRAPKRGLMRAPGVQRFTDVDTLAEQGFLIVSADYRVLSQTIR